MKAFVIMFIFIVIVAARTIYTDSLNKPQEEIKCHCPAPELIAPPEIHAYYETMPSIYESLKPTGPGLI
jgi:hypothetical protein